MYMKKVIANGATSSFHGNSTLINAIIGIVKSSPSVAHNTRGP